MRRFRSLLIAGFVCGLPFASLAQAQEKKKIETPIWSDQKDAFGDPLPVGAIARIGTTRYRLSDSHLPHSATMSPDGKLLLILRQPDEIEIWELPAWKRYRVVKCQCLGSTMFSSDSKKLVIFDGALQKVQLVDLDSGKVTKQIDLSKELGKDDDFPRLKLSRDQQTLIITNNMIGPVGRDRIRVWDVAKDKMVQSFYVLRTGNNGHGFAISADCRWLARNTADFASNDLGPSVTYSIGVYDLLAGKSIRWLETELPMQKLVLSPNGKWLAASNYGSILRIFDDSGKERHNIRMKPSMLPMEFSPDGNSLYLADDTGNIQKWNPATGERMANYPAPYRCSVSQLAFQPDGKVMALGISAYALHLWDITSGKSIPPRVHASVISDLAFSPQGELLVASEEGMLASWNPRTGAKLRDLNTELFRSDNFLDYQYSRMGFDGKRQRRDGSSLTFSPSGKFLAHLSNLYEMKTGKWLWPDRGDVFFGPGRDEGAMSFLDGERNVASVLQRKVRIWSIGTGRDVTNFNLPLRGQEMAVMLRVTPNGKHFAFGTVANRKYAPIGTVSDEGDLAVRLWSVTEKKFVREWRSLKYQEAMEFSPDNQWFAFAGENDRVQLARIDSAIKDFGLQLGDNSKKITQLAFSPDSRQLACAAVASVQDREVGRIFIVEMASKKIRLELVGHPTGIIERLAFSHDAALLASGATDTTALVWNAGLRASASKPAIKDSTAKELDERFQQMAGTDAKTAYQSMIKFAQRPKQAVILFEEKVPPAKKADKKVNEVLHARAVEVLEAIASPEARTLLTRWTTGDPAAVLTVEATRALARLR